MTTTRIPTWLAATLVALLVTGPLAAQRAEESPPDSASAEEDTTPKKKGLFGKVKSVAGNKIVKAVAKTAACTMLPGGQVIAGAIDAAGSNSAGEAASGAAGAATGTSCMPGMGGVAGAAGAGAAGLAGVSGGGPAGLAGMAAGGVAGGPTETGPMREMPMGYAPGMTGAGYGAPQDIDATATCLGLSPSEYQDLVDPTRGEPRSPTKDEAKRQRHATKKMDTRKYQQCLMAGEPAGEDDE
jgi:hypothetical protein